LIITVATAVAATPTMLALVQMGSRTATVELATWTALSGKDDAALRVSVVEGRARIGRAWLNDGGNFPFFSCALAKLLPLSI